MELFRIKKDIPFMSYGRLTTTISLLTFLLAVYFLATKGLALGVDFTGGTVMEVSYPQAANISKIRSAVDSIGLKEVTVQNFGTSHDVLIRLPVKQGVSSAKLSEQVCEVLRHGDAQVEMRRVEFVGPPDPDLARHRPPTPRVSSPGSRTRSVGSRKSAAASIPTWRAASSRPEQAAACSCSSRSGPASSSTSCRY